jgi:ABC-type glycerol-3-phosphate transport system substrate-binding protein
MSRRRLLGTAAGVAGAFPFASMLGNSRYASAQAQISGDLEFWSRESFDNGVRQPLIEERLAAFDEQFGTDTAVQFMVFQESIQKMQAAVAAGNPPDLGQQGPDVTLQFAAGGYLEPVDDLYAGIKDQLLPLQKEAFVSVDGTMFSMPWYVETRVLFYHKDLLEAAGIQPPTTFAEWTEAAKALTKGDEQYGFVISPEGPGPGQLWVPLASSSGGNLLSADGAIQANTDPFKSSLQFLADLYAAKVMPEATPTYTGNDVTQLFLLKKSAMNWGNGAVLIAAAAQAPDLLENIGAVLTPTAEAGGISRSFLGGFQLFMFNQGKNIDGAKELIKYLLEPEWYSGYMQFTKGAALPVTTAAAADPFYQNDPVLKTMVDQIPTAIRYGGPDYGNAPYLGEAEGALLFSQPVIDVMTGAKTVDEAVQGLQEGLEALAAQ